jgi:hypothetical protein
MPAPSLEDLNRLAEKHTRNREDALRDSSLDEKKQLVVKVADAMLAWTARIGAQIQDRTIRDHAQSEIQALRLGKVVLLGVAGELFSTLGQEIKHHGGSLQVLVSTCTNGSVGYIADREAYPLATYEISEAYKYYGEPSALSPEAGDLIVTEAAALIGRS